MSGIDNKVGAIMFISINQVSVGLYTTLYPFILERPIFLREYANKTYGWGPYFIAKSIIELPIQLILPTFFSLVVYFALGFNNSIDHFGFFLLVLMCAVSCGASMGFFLGCVFQTLQAAVQLNQLVVVLPIIFNGIIANLHDLPVYLRWITYLSVYRYECEALIYNEFEDKVEMGIVPFSPMEKYDYNLGKWMCIYLMLAIMVGFRVLALFAFRLNIRKVQ